MYPQPLSHCQPVEPAQFGAIVAGGRNTPANIARGIWRICAISRSLHKRDSLTVPQFPADGTSESRKNSDFFAIPDIWQPSCFLLMFPEVPALEITLHHSGGARFVAEARQHRLVIDQPAEDGATDHGMSPAELLLVALGSCVGQYVSQYLIMRSLPSKGLMIRVAAERAARPLRVTDFRIDIVAPGLTDRQIRALEKTFPSGLVHNALLRENAICVSIASTSADDFTP